MPLTVSGAAKRARRATAQRGTALVMDEHALAAAGPGCSLRTMLGSTGEHAADSLPSFRAYLTRALRAMSFRGPPVWQAPNHARQNEAPRDAHHALTDPRGAARWGAGLRGFLDGLDGFLEGTRRRRMRSCQSGLLGDLKSRCRRFNSNPVL